MTINHDSNSKYITYLIVGIYFVLFSTSLEDPFFWDTIQLGSKHAHWFYENGYSSVSLPEIFDSGHIPTFGIYLSIIWKIFGKTLIASHIAMLPFVVMSLFFTYKICFKLFPNWHKLAWSILIFEPTLVAQNTLVSPDVILFSFLSMGYWAWISKKSKLLSIACLGLILISNRGFLVSLIFPILAIIDYFLYDKEKLKLRFYLPAICIYIAYQLYHLQYSGWIGYHDDSPWAESFETINFLDLFKQFGIAVWRLIDFGRVTVFVLLIAFSFSYFVRKGIKLEALRMFLPLLATSIILLGITIPFANLLGHRYYIPIYFFASILTMSLISKGRKTHMKFYLFGILISFLLGHFVIYPDKIAQGWDASLSYLPYADLRQETMTFLEKNKISTEEVGSFFPNVSGFKYTDLKDTELGFHKADLHKDDFILYSNIMNIDDKTYDILMSDKWQVAYLSSRRGIRVILFKKDTL